MMTTIDTLTGREQGTSMTTLDQCRQLLLAAMTDGVSQWSHPSVLSDEQLRGMAALLATMTTRRLKIAWYQTGPTRQDLATVFGLYAVRQGLGQNFFYFTPAFPNWVVCDSIDHGKQLCEVDYRARVEALFVSDAAAGTEPGKDGGT